MEVVVEVIVQIVVEVLGDALLELGFHGASRVIRSRAGRTVLSVGAGFAFGVFWGSYLADQGTIHRPRLLWVTIGVAAVAGIAAVWRRQTGRRGTDGTFVWPWQWTDARLVSFALMNAAIAAGILTGWHPPGLR